MNSKTTLLSGSVLGGLSVAFGAFGAHMLESSLSAEDLAIFETGVRYQMYHALALILCAGLSRGAGFAAHGFLWGTIIFSGSLYLLVLTDARWLGAITPIGGTLLLIGWAVLVFRSVSRTAS